MPESKTTLKPCPFCGSSNIDIHHQNMVVLVECMGCFTRKHVWAKSLDDGRKQAESFWNKRAA